MVVNIDYYHGYYIIDYDYLAITASSAMQKGIRFLKDQLHVTTSNPPRKILDHYF